MSSILDFFTWVSAIGMLLLTTFYMGVGQPATPVDTLYGTTTALVVAVIDGDTIEVETESSNLPIKVRYIGINTPEPYHEEMPECGSYEASNRNRELVSGQTIELVAGTKPYDSYGRLLAYVYVGETFVNEVLVAEGYARVMMIAPNIEHENKFRELYKKARVDKRGIWAGCDERVGSIM